MECSRQTEVAELKQEHSRVLMEQQQVVTQEKARVETEFQQALKQMTARAETAERMSEDLQKQLTLATSSGKSRQERLEASDADLQEVRRDNKSLREQLKQLELLKYQHEREI